MSEILINKTTRGIQHQPGIAQAFDSLFCVVWRDAGEAAIKGRIIKVDGSNGGEEFTVNTKEGTDTNTNRISPAIVLSGGGLAVAWIEMAFNPPGPRPHVKLQRFDLSGRKIGPAIQVSTTDVDPDNRLAITSMIDGGVLITWVDTRSGQRIRAQRFDINGSKKGPEFTVNTTEGFHQNPRAERLVDGNYVITWRNDPSSVAGGALVFRVFDLEGVPQTGEIIPNISGFRGGKAMTLLDDGRFVIAHVRTTTSSDIGVVKSNVEANVFEADGAPSHISMFASNERGINCSFPALAPLPGGRFLLSWVQKSAETFTTVPNVKAKIFSTSQGSVGREVEANTSTGGDRFNVCTATAFGDGEESAFIAWADDGATGGGTSDTSIRGRGFRIVNGELVAAE
jgi:hypothetical protein